MTVSIVGIGLIGGSMALALKEKGFADKVIGVDASPEHCEKALSLGLVDEIAELTNAVVQSDLIILATPINVAEILLPVILSLVDKQVVMDVGSTKKVICESVANNPNRGRFVATHPMWGADFHAISIS